MARPTKATPAKPESKNQTAAASPSSVPVEEAAAAVTTNYTSKVPKYMRASTAGSLLDEDLTPEIALWRTTKHADGFKMMSEIYKDYLPLPHMTLQYLIRRIGFPVNAFYEFTGEENVGKSTLMMYLLGYWATYNIPSLYINTDPKIMDVSWATRIVHRDKKTAKRIVEKAIRVLDNAYTYDDMEDAITKWAKFQREDLGRPMNIPIVVVIDQISKLLNKKEAESLALDSKTQHTLISEGGNLPTTTAKYVHGFSRIMRPYMDTYNITILVVSSTNTAIDMKAGPSMFAASAKNNTTRIGGRALPQSEALLITMTKGAQYKEGETVVGRNINLRVQKNSYGANVMQDVGLIIRNERFTDTDDMQECPLDMDYTICDTISALKIWGTVQTKRRFTCDRLGLSSATASTMYAKIVSDPALQAELGTLLNIHGYEAIRE